MSNNKTPQVSTHPSLYELLLGPMKHEEALPFPRVGASNQRDFLRSILDQTLDFIEESVEDVPTLNSTKNKPKTNKVNQGKAPPRQ